MKHQFGEACPSLILLHMNCFVTNGQMDACADTDVNARVDTHVDACLDTHLHWGVAVHVDAHLHTHADAHHHAHVHMGWLRLVDMFIWGGYD